MITNFYDLFDLPFIFDKRTNPRLALARRIPNKPLSVLDICTGTAIGSIIVAEANPLNRIVGIDLSSDALIIAEERIRRRNILNIVLKQMDAANMQFEDECFDVIMVSFGMHELREEVMMPVLKETCRLLKKGGKLFIMDYARQGGPLINVFFSLYLKVFEPKHIFRFLKYDWHGILQSVGLKTVSVDQCFFAKIVLAVR